MERTVERGLDWAGLPAIATVARLLGRDDSGEADPDTRWEPVQ